MRRPACARAEVLPLLRREGLVAESLAEKMLAWRHTGFSAHNAVRVALEDLRTVLEDEKSVGGAAGAFEGQGPCKR